MPCITHCDFQEVFTPLWKPPPIFMIQGQILRDPLRMVSAGRCSQSAFTSPTNLESQQWNALQNSRMMLLNCWHLANGSVAKSLKDLQLDNIRKIMHSHEQKLSVRRPGAAGHFNHPARGGRRR
jgi:hypothetical protein